MLTASGSTRVGVACMRWAVAFGRRVRLSIVERDGLSLDTRFVPPSSHAPDHGPCLYIVLRGTWRVEGGSFEVTGPAAFVVSEEHLEGAHGSRSLTYRTDGADFSAIEVHLEAEDTSLRPGAGPISVALDERVWRAAEQVASVHHGDERVLDTAVPALLDALGASRLVTPELATGAAWPAAPAFGRLWTAVRPMVERLELLPTVQQIAGLMGATPQEVDRHVRAFVAASGLVGTGWRAATRHLRLKMAVIMLSAKDASVADVARAAGYGSSIAMCRAFRDARLPSPGMVQQALTLPAAADERRFDRARLRPAPVAFVASAPGDDDEPLAEGTDRGAVVCANVHAQL